MPNVNSSGTHTAPLPWHRDVVDKLATAWRVKRMPHALLLHGAQGLGKRALANWLARTLLCDERRTDFAPCDRCAACALLAAGTHPDLYNIAPEEDKQLISVDQIRATCAELALTSYRGGYKVALIEPAHSMTLAAANSLLKTLEEPAPNTLLILLTVRPSALLATLRSRCQQLKVRTPDTHTASAWLAATNVAVSSELLALANGAPLKALALAQGEGAELWSSIEDAMRALLEGRADVTHIAKQWSNEDLPERLELLDRWLARLIRCSFDQTDEPVTRRLLPSVAPTLNISRMFSCLDRVRELRAVLTRTALQRELATEAVLLPIIDTLGRGVRVN